MADRNLQDAPNHSEPNTSFTSMKDSSPQNQETPGPCVYGRETPSPCMSGPETPSSQSQSGPSQNQSSPAELGSAAASSSRPRGLSFGSSLSSRIRSARNKRRSQQQKAADMLDLIVEFQGQRLNDQRASVSMLPASAVCEACDPAPPGLDFYCRLIHYQSDRLNDQRSSLPDHQEGFYSLVERLQSRRMDEQRSLLTPPDDVTTQAPPL